MKNLPSYTGNQLTLTAIYTRFPTTTQYKDREYLKPLVTGESFQTNAYSIAEKRERNENVTDHIGHLLTRYIIKSSYKLSR